MKIIADTHMHTIVSGDAHSTLSDYINKAKNIGLKYIFITEHSYSIPRACPPEYFYSMCSIPREYEGVNIARGCEVNIINYDGELDLPDAVLDYLDIVIASLHDLVIAPASEDEHTRCWANIAKNPLIDIIGHCGDPRYSFNIEKIIPLFGEYGKVVEINNHSFVARKGSDVKCREIALACKKYRVPVVVSSDAHFVDNLGEFGYSLAMLKEIKFPDNLILNSNEKALKKLVSSSVRNF